MSVRRADNRGFRLVALRAIHLTVLSSFALAQPLFDILGRNATFFAARDSSSREIVLFAVVLTLLLPAVLVVVELLAGLVSPLLAGALHLLFVGGLTVLIAIQALKRWDSLSATAVLVGAAALGAVAAFLYERVRAVPSFLTVLSPAPIVFLALFLGDSQVKHLVFVKEEPVRTVRVESRTPVVFVVLDEFATHSLMDRTEQIDARRFPNFASLASSSTWYRSATTANAHTEVAVPALLAGSLPKGQPAPIAADYPHNVFTLLGRSYRMQVMESLTRMCPRSLCKKRVSLDREDDEDAGVSGSTRSLASDVGIVYLHVLLPDQLATHVTPIDGRWGNFGGKAKRRKSRPHRGATQACGRNICRFRQLISNDPKPSLFFLHAILPHAPWAYLPSGKRYTGNIRVVPGNDEGKWRNDEWLTLQAYQRYLLQVGYTDAALGLILKRLRSTGLYDRSLVIVTVDEGISFHPGEPGRNLTRSNLADLVFVPLFIKLPGQKRGRIEDGLVRTLDILPTIARVVRARMPWPVQGRSLIGRRLARDGMVSAPDQQGNPVTAPLSELIAERRQSLQRQVAAFGTGSFARVYRIGPFRELIGRRVSELSVEPAGDSRVDVDGAELLQAVEPDSDAVPSYVTGRITHGGNEDEPLAIAVNGVIAATTRSYSHFGEQRFAAIVPEHLLRRGANEVGVFVVRVQGSRVVLEELRGSRTKLVLSSQDGREVIEGAGRPVRVVRGALTGQISARTPGGNAVFGGSTSDAHHRAADSIVLFVDGRSIYLAPGTNVERPGQERNRFYFELPKRLLPEGGQGGRIRAFAIRGDVASELRYVGVYLRAGRRG